MEEQKVPQILEELKQAYPNLEFSVLPTQRHNGMKLVVIKGFDDNSEKDIDDWSVDVVYPILWGTIMPLAEKYEAMRYVRFIFIRGTEFVLHSPDVGLGSVFACLRKPIDIHVVVFGSEKRRHYVGECQKINDVIDFLTNTPGIYF